MDEPEVDRAEQLLQRIESADRDLNRVGDLTAEEEGLLRTMQSVATSIHPVPEDAPNHYTLEELHTLRDQRMGDGEQWQMPEHLSRCPLCLEEFSVLLEEAPAPSSSAIRRYFKEAHRTLIPFTNVLPSAGWRERAAAAAAAAVLLIGLSLFMRGDGNAVAQPSGVRIDGGSLTLADGRPLPADQAVQADQLIHARDACSAVFADGSRLEIEKGSSLSFRASEGGGTSVRLQEGEVLASVQPQATGAVFAVETELGRICVVGTRFRVRSRLVKGGEEEPAVLKEGLRQVQVEVLEGEVRVERGAATMTLGPGQSVRLSGDEERIRLLDE